MIMTATDVKNSFGKMIKMLDYEDNICTIRIGLKLHLVMWTVVLLFMSCNNLFALEQPKGQLVLGSTVTGSINKSEDWYQLVLDQECTVQVTMDASATLTPSFTVYSGDGTTDLITKSNLRLGETAQGAISLMKGTYYIAVSAHYPNDYGNYSLDIERVDNAYGNDFEPNNGIDAAMVLHLGNSYEGYVNSTNGVVTDHEDWYKLVLAEEGTVQMIMDAGEALTPEFHIYNGDGRTPVTDVRDLKPGGEARIEVSLSAGTYYIVASNYYTNDYGSYNLTVQRVESTYVNDLEPNNGMDEATVVNLDNSYGGYVNSTNGIVKDEEDWYKFTVAEEAVIQVMMDASEGLTPSVEVYNEDGTTSVGSLKDSTPSGEVTLTLPLMAGTYYTVLSNFYVNDYGSYRLDLRQLESVYKNDAEPNNSAEEAVNTSIGNVYTGYINSTNGLMRDYKDWYKITLASQRTVAIVLEPSDGLTPDFDIFRADGTTYITGAAGETQGEKAIKQVTLPGGTYYIVVSAQYVVDFGSYSLDISRIIDHEDLVNIKGHYGDRTGDEQYDFRVDENADGIIDITDIVNLMKGFVS